MLTFDEKYYLKNYSLNRKKNKNDFVEIKILFDLTIVKLFFHSLWTHSFEL